MWGEIRKGHVFRAETRNLGGQKFCSIIKLLLQTTNYSTLYNLRHNKQILFSFFFPSGCSRKTFDKFSFKWWNFRSCHLSLPDGARVIGSYLTKSSCGLDPRQQRALMRQTRAVRMDGHMAADQNALRTTFRCISADSESQDMYSNR